MILYFKNINSIFAVRKIKKEQGLALTIKYLTIKNGKS
jgi:hypothetical protein